MTQQSKFPESQTDVTGSGPSKPCGWAAKDRHRSNGDCTEQGAGTRVRSRVLCSFSGAKRCRSVGNRCSLLPTPLLCPLWAVVLALLAGAKARAAASPINGSNQIAWSVPAGSMFHAHSQQWLSETTIRLSALDTKEDNWQTSAVGQKPAPPVGEGDTPTTESVNLAAVHRDRVHNKNPHIPQKAAVADQDQKNIEQRASERDNWTNKHGLGRYHGQARASLAAPPTRVFSIQRSSESFSQWTIDYNQPLAEFASSTWLFELGSRTKNSEHLASAGLVYHYQWRNGKVLSGNIFVDRGISEAQTRGSIGLEWMGTELGLTSNFYMPLGGWEINPLIYQPIVVRDTKLWAQPAIGLDVGLENVVRAYRSLRVKANYTYWYGDYVDITDQQSGTLNSPSSLTLAVYWQPIPLFRLLFDRTAVIGKNQTNNRVIAELYFDFEKPWRDLLRSTSNIASTSTQSRDMRRRFAKRNRDMILRYRKALLTKPGFGLTIFPEDNKELQEEYLSQKLANHDAIQIIDADGNWAEHIHLPKGEQLNGKIVTITHTATNKTHVHAGKGGNNYLPDTPVKNKETTLRYTGDRWLQAPGRHKSMELDIGTYEHLMQKGPENLDI